MPNKEPKNPAEGDARIAKIKEGRTRLTHKAEHGVGLHTGTAVAVTLHGADQLPGAGTPHFGERHRTLSIRRAIK